MILSKHISLFLEYLVVGKSVSIQIPNGLWSNDHIGFGFCPDPMLVRINVSRSRWEVDVFTLSSQCLGKGAYFGKLPLPDRLSLIRKWRVAEVKDSLGVLEYDGDGGYGVWMMEFVTKSFTKMFTVKVSGKLLNNGVLEFRKNHEVTIQVEEDGSDNKSSLEA
ncbi:hypothetical protein Tco_0441146 [Tanacetum coccineum]